MYKIFLFLTFISYNQALPADNFQWENLWAGKIVGGEPVNDYLPYQVSLQRPSHYCGGSIISEFYVLTACHCVNRTVTTSDTVAWGGVYKSSLPLRARAVEFICHPGYDRSTLDNDLALVKVDTSLFTGTGNEQARPIPFCNTNCTNKISGMPLSTSGWGALQEGGSSPEQLQTVDILSVDQATCNADYSPLGYKVLDSMICAGVEEGGKDACQGDSGGPLVTMEKNQTCLIGCTSWGEGCARKEYPGVWSIACKYLPWITEIVGTVQVVS